MAITLTAFHYISNSSVLLRKNSSKLRNNATPNLYVTFGTPLLFPFEVHSTLYQCIRQLCSPVRNSHIMKNYRCLCNRGVKREAQKTDEYRISLTAVVQKVPLNSPAIEQLFSLSGNAKLSGCFICIISQTKQSSRTFKREAKSY